jgi:hypothetical protein
MGGYQSAVAFTGADIPALYYESNRDGDDASLLALIGRWLDGRGPETVIDLAAYIATESMAE